jgi:monoamine oxidase
VPSFDVAILGAGIGGLCAAEGLARRGRKVLLLEARDRLGGRIDTRHEAGWPIPIEAGAEFMHGLSPALEGLRRRLHLSRRELEQRHGQPIAGRLRAADRVWQAAMKLLDNLPRDGRDRSYAALCKQTWWQDLADRRTQQLALSFVEGFNATPANLVSAISLGQQTEASSQIEGERLFHLAGGYGALVDKVAARTLRAGVDVRTGTIVRRVSWRRGQVKIQAENALGQPLPTEIARAALVTLPAAVLQAAPRSPAGVRFSPALPAANRAALEGVRPGPVIRILLQLRRLPDPMRAGGFTFLHAPRAKVPTFWRAGAGDEPVLVGWSAGPAALALAGASESARIAAALDSLGRALGKGWDRRRLGRDLVSWRIFDWQTDPFARGAYSYLAPGAHDAPRVLAAPVDQTLFFAGEATNTTGNTGTVHGAIETATRAIAQIDAGD